MLGYYATDCGPEYSLEYFIIQEVRGASVITYSSDKRVEFYVEANNPMVSSGLKRRVGDSCFTDIVGKNF